MKVPAGTWKVDRAHSSVAFEVKHMMIATVRGHFGSFEAGIEEFANRKLICAVAPDAPVGGFAG